MDANAPLFGTCISCATCVCGWLRRGTASAFGRRMCSTASNTADLDKHNTVATMTSVRFSSTLAAFLNLFDPFNTDSGVKEGGSMAIGGRFSMAENVFDYAENFSFDDSAW